MNNGLFSVHASSPGPQSSVPNGAPVTVVKTIADLKVLYVGNLLPNTTVSVLGYYAANDGGGGEFLYSPVSSATVDNGIVISPTIGSGRWLRIFDVDIDPMWFGAIGDGIADDTAAINSAITACNTNGGGKVVSKHPHLITSPILMVSGVRLEIWNTLTCSGMSVDTGNFGTNDAILFKGSSISTTTLTAPAVQGQTAVFAGDGFTYPYFDVTSVSGLSVGDMLTLELSQDFSPPNIQQGVDTHLCQIKGITSLRVYVDNPIPRTFNDTYGVVRKVVLCENASAYVNKIAGAPVNGCTLWWARKCTFSGRVDPIGENAFYIHAAFGNTIRDVIGVNPVSTVSPYGYGFLIDYGSANNIVESCYFEDVRECSTGDNARYNIIRNNTVIRPIDNGINVHGRGETDIIIEGNTILGSKQYGISIGLLAASGGLAVNQRTIVRNNKILDSQSYGIREIQYDSSTVTDTIIEGNIISGSTAFSAIYISGSGTATNNINSKIRNNKILSSGSRGIELSSQSIYGAQITDNEIYNTSDDGILIQDIRGNTVVTLNRIDTAGGYGIRELNTTDNSLTNNSYELNRITSSTNHGIYLNATGTNRIRSAINHNMIRNAGASGIFLNGTGVVQCTIHANVIDLPIGEGIMFNGTGDGHITSLNIIRNAGNVGIRNTTAGTRIITISNAVESSTGAAYQNLCNAAPTTGTWYQGDIVNNIINLSSGSAAGWICYASGTPGSWQQISVLS